MRKSTALMSGFKAETKSGESLKFELCKGGYFSTKDEYGLKVVGKTKQDSLSGKNLCYTYYERTPVTNYGDIAATNKRTLDEKCYYIGACYDNTWNNSQVESVTITNKQITIIKNTKASGYGVGLPVKVKANTVYTISFGNGNDEVQVGFYTEDGTFINFSISPYFTTPDNCYWAVLVIGGTKLNATYTYTDIQLEEGTTATSYEPYCGGIPAPNPDYPMPIQCVKAGTELIGCGNNLLDLSKCVGASYFGVAFTVEGDTIRCKGTTTQTIIAGLAFAAYRDNSLSGKGYTIKLFDYPKKYMTGACWGLRTENERSIAGNFVFDTAGEEIDFTFKVMVTHDKTLATEYQPFRGLSIITTPCDLYEGDIWYPTSGKVERHNYYQVMDSEALSKAYITSTVAYKSVSDFILYDVVANIGGVSTRLCSNYAKGAYIASGSLEKDTCCVTPGDKRLRFTTASPISKEWFQEKIDNDNPFAIVYSLAEPITEQYPPQPIFAPQGTVNVLQEPTELTAALEATHLVRG